METIHTKGTGTVTVILLGIVLALILLAVGYVFFGPFQVTSTLFEKNPSEEQTETATAGTIIKVDGADTTTDTVSDTTAPTTNESFTLSAEQKAALDGFGIDPSTVPSTVTPLQVACFEEELGADRVSEIRNGDVPSAFEFFKVKNCIN